jgi:NAD(P)-dependent dehydrogenase (short-subunit alcohol dehydrogenase family)
MSGKRRQLLLTGGRAGHSVLATARSPAKADATLASVRAQCPDASIEVDTVELTSWSSIRAFAQRTVERVGAGGRQIDVLHHNAGILLASERRSMTSDGVEATLAVNAVAPLLLTRMFKDALARPARVTVAASGLHRPGQRGDEVDFRFDDPHLETRYTRDRAYKNSKLALQWVVSALDRRLAPEGIRVDAICPGFVPETAAQHFSGARRLFLGRVLKHAPFATTLETSARNMAAHLTDPKHDGDGGRFFNQWEVAEASADARDPDQAERFYAMACEWAGLTVDPAP